MCKYEAKIFPASQSILYTMSENGHMKANYMVRVEFKTGPYKDTIEFDGVPMTVCHLLSGQPWQYGRNIQ
jgi:hypothetical protein